MLPTPENLILEKDEAKFSLVAGGPVYRLFVRLHLGHEEKFPVMRRILFVAAFAWLPLFALNALVPVVAGVKVTFLHDIYVHVRFLIALPILIAIEPQVHTRLSVSAHAFIQRNIVRHEDIRKFSEAVEAAHRLRNSWVFELSLLAAVYTFGLWFWTSHVAFDVPTWYASPHANGLNLTPAGYWFAFVSVPLVQFFTLRWYARFFIWFWFLQRVSKFDLNLVPTHPDRAAGLGFLGRATYAFAPILFAQGAVLSAFVASEVLHNERDLASFKVTAVGFVIFFLIAAFSPPLVFMGRLITTKRNGLMKYGTLASRYVEGFDDKWVKGINPENEQLLGTGDIQSLADLSNAYSIVREMNLTPFVYQDVIRLALVSAIPLLPLSLFIFSLEEILDNIIRIMI